jgi:hypothetical protein
MPNRTKCILLVSVTGSCLQTERFPDEKLADTANRRTAGQSRGRTHGPHLGFFCESCTICGPAMWLAMRSSLVTQGGRPLSAEAAPRHARERRSGPYGKPTSGFNGAPLTAGAAKGSCRCPPHRGLTSYCALQVGSNGILLISATSSVSLSAHHPPPGGLCQPGQVLPLGFDGLCAGTQSQNGGGFETLRCAAVCRGATSVKGCQHRQQGRHFPALGFERVFPVSDACWSVLTDLSYRQGLGFRVCLVSPD